MKSISLVMLETQYHVLAQTALQKTIESVPKHVKIDEILTFSNRPIMSGARNVKVEHFPDVIAYCEFMLRGMLEHVQTETVLFVQWDAMGYDRSQWTDDFLDYDYIGAPWPWYNDDQCVGNGGFSLRSYKLLEALQDQHIQMIAGDSTAEYEDRAIGMKYRSYLETQYGIRYAPRELAAQFSYELGPYKPSFAFHGVWNLFRLADPKVADFYMRYMDYKGWNIYKWHHTLYEIGRLNDMKKFNYVNARLKTYAPELVTPVLEWLSKEDFTKDIY